MQDGDNMVLRQSGDADSGDLSHIYAVDTRHVVQLQFYPEGYEWAETEPIVVSKGFAGSKVLPMQNLAALIQLTRRFRL